MSEYYGYEDLGGGGDEPCHDLDASFTDAHGFDFNHDGGYTYDAHTGTDHGYGTLDSHEHDASHTDGSHTDDHVDALAAAEPTDAGTHANLLDGLDLDFSNVDLAGLVDNAFHASYDLIGSDPDESGWWDTLASEHNHDGAYDEVAADLDTNPYVTH